jgi:hypothetical protein
MAADRLCADVDDGMSELVPCAARRPSGAGWPPLSGCALLVQPWSYISLIVMRVALFCSVVCPSVALPME